MPVLLIYFVGAGGTGLILFMGWLWRWRNVLSAAATAAATAALVVGVIVLWPRAFPQPGLTVPRAPVSPTLSVMTWGERDAANMVTSPTDSTPSHIVVAHLEITAGDIALSIPALGTPHPTNLLWLGVRDTGRANLGDPARRATDGTMWLPSHSAELVKDFGDAPLMFPDAGCAAVAPGARCEVTIVWEIGEHGSVEITSLALLPADTDPATSTPTATLVWPAADTAQPVCDGLIKQWCTI